MLINFDYDGVIVDSFQQLLELAIQAQFVIGEGRKPIEADFAKCENLTFEFLAEQLGISSERIPEYAELILKLQNDGDWNPPLFPGIHSVFAILSRQHELAIITASSASTVIDSLTKHGLEGFVSHISGGELGLSKADRIKHSCSANKVQPANAFMVGDTIGDIRQGKIARVKTVAITWGYQSYETLCKENPDFIIDTPYSLLSFFRKE